MRFSINIVTYLLFALIFSSGCNGSKNSPFRKSDSRLDTALAICARAQSIPLDTFEKYSRLSVVLANEQDDSLKKLKAESYLSNYYFSASMFDSAFLQVEKISRYPKLANDTLHIDIASDILRGVLYIRKGQFKEGLEWYNKIYPKVERSKSVPMLAKLSNNIGLANLEMTRYEEAIRWFRKVISMPVKKNAIIKLTASVNMAICFANIEKLDSATKYCMLAIDLENKNPNLLVKANTFNILADIYRQKDDFANAEKAMLQSKEVRKTIGDPFYIISDLSQLASLYADMGRFKEGIAAAEEGLELAKKHGIDGQLSFAIHALWNNYIRSGDHKKAAELGMEYIGYMDSISNTASAKELTEWEVKYETEKKNQQIQKQHYQITIKNYWIMGSIFLLLMVLLLSYFIFKSRSNRQRAILHEMDLNQQTALTKAIIEAEESERNKISFNMHDGLGQYLSVIKMNLQSVKDKVSVDERTANVFDATQKMVDESITEMRSISHQIMPNEVMRKGLANALKDLIEKIDSNRLKIILDVDSLSSAIDTDIQLVIYRILQECINNVIKHSKADKLNIHISQHDNRLRATVQDNGVGFSTSRSDYDGIGLQSIQTRVKYLKGTLNIESQRDKGTEIHLDIPLQ